MTADLHWHAHTWPELPRDVLYAMLQLRQRVFVLEQGPYLDLDGLDAVSDHLGATLAQAHGELPAGAWVAYQRVVHPGHKYAEPAIGRVAVRHELRGSAIGRALVAQGVAWCDTHWPRAGIRISAQAHLQRFYGAFGFATVGDVYLEDGIPHTQMRRAPVIV